jgi:hypothetical protein
MQVLTDDVRACVANFDTNGRITGDRAGHRTVLDTLTHTGETGLRGSDLDRGVSGS